MGAFKEFYLNEVDEKQIKLFKYNKRSGIWDLQRMCNLDTAQEWLKHFEKDEPDQIFKLSKNKPNYNPYSEIFGKKSKKNESLEESEKMYYMVINRKGKYPYTKVYDNLKPMTHKECMTFKSKQTDPSDWTIKEIEE